MVLPRLDRYISLLYGLGRAGVLVSPKLRQLTPTSKTFGFIAIVLNTGLSGYDAVADLGVLGQ